MMAPVFACLNKSSLERVQVVQTKSPSTPHQHQSPLEDFGFKMLELCMGKQQCTSESLAPYIHSRSLRSCDKDLLWMYGYKTKGALATVAPRLLISFLLSLRSVDSLVSFTKSL